MIKVEHLSKKYGDLTILKDVNVEIGKGEVVSIIGPSGTGKSTFLRCLNLLEKPTGGNIFIHGVNILDKKTDLPKIRQKANMVFQSFNLFAHLTALENLMLSPVKLLGISKQDAGRKSMEMLRLVGLGEKAHHYPHELSGGQKQRVAIARCLAMDPEIILLDEPTSALDPTMVSEVVSVIRRLAREGITMAIVTHEMDLARDVSNRVLYMDEGIIYEIGTPEQIFDNPTRPKTRVFINRVRSLNYHIETPDYDLYAMNAEIESFCEKHSLAKSVCGHLLLLVEELLQLYGPLLNDNSLDIKITYSEKNDKIEIACECASDLGNPIKSEHLPDELGLTIIKSMSESILFEQTPEKSVLNLRMRMD